MKLTVVDLQPHIERCKEQLRPTKAGKTGDQNSESISISLNKEGAIRRKWLGISGKDIHIFRAYLDYYTDASNDEPMGYVDNPVVGDGTGKQMQAVGRYRNAFTIVRAMAEDRYELIQELRLGWITSLGSGGSVSYDEARCETIDWYIGDAGDNTTNDYITLVWKGVDPQAVEGISQYLLSLPSTGWTPLVNGNQLGSHHRLFVRATEEADGSASIRMVLANSRLKYETFSDYATENAGTVTYHFGVPSDLVQSVLDAEDAIGFTARVSPPDQRGLHDITISVRTPTEIEDLNRLVAASCSEETYQSVYYGVTEEDADAVVIPEEIPNGTSYTLRRQSRGDGFWNVILERTVTKYQNLPLYVSEQSAGREVTVRQQLGVTDEVLEEIVEAQGYVKRQRKRLNNDCSLDVETEKIESKPQAGVEIRGTSKYTSNGTLNTNVRSPAGYSVPSAGVTRTYVERPNIDGTFDVTQRDDEAPALDGENKRVTPTGGSSDATIYRNASSIPATPTPDQGEIILYDKRENDDGTFDGSIRTDVSPVLISEETVATVKATRTGTGTRNKRGTQPVAPTPATGQRVSHRVEQNEDNTWNENTIIEEAVSGLSAGGGSRASCRTLGTDSTLRNVTLAEKDAALNAVVLVAGQRLVWTERENEDGTWDLNYRVEVSPAVSSTSKLIRTHGGFTEEISRNIPEEDLRDIDLITAEQGKTKTIRQDENPDCGYDETYREEIAPPLIANQEIIRADVEISVEKQQNASAQVEVGTPAANTHVEVSNDENPDGTWNTSRRVDTPQSQEAFFSIATFGGTVYTAVFKNYTSTQVNDLLAIYETYGRLDLGGGVFEERSNRTMECQPNQYDLFDGSIKVSPNLQSGGTATIPEKSTEWTITLGTEKYKVEVIVTANEEAAGAHADGTVLPDGYKSGLPMPGVNYIGRGKYKAVKITRTSS